MADYRLGIDFGGTKIEVLALDRSGTEVLRERVPNPGVYDQAVLAVRDLVQGAEQKIGCVSGHRITGTQPTSTLGVGIPGSLAQETGLVHNSNATWLNNHPFGRDLEAALERPVRVENDANCFALSEAADGAGAGYNTVFGVIIGTGMGGGIVANGRVLGGRHGIAGEWGHIPLPWAESEDEPMRPCFCGNVGCQERYLCGPVLAEEWHGPGHRSPHGIEEAARNGDPAAIKALDRYIERFARACGQAINFLDPDVIVLGGGVSNLKTIYERLPKILPKHVITSPCTTPVVKNRHGDSSGVRGAAWLWDLSETGAVDNRPVGTA
ncbi:ROK family protein [Oecophyllibacter saccharovorans]|uniref:ROK family protein n=1 Tax=Oecophyllibacter saccharovorans TaxID=2558360 RepID=UPI00116A8DF9|nr:ROK family protein [Oecophyllibacter saccharovorans]TPW33741.1 ROK family protein [Oecophyllibacter saccharovorans]